MTHLPSDICHRPFPILAALLVLGFASSGQAEEPVIKLHPRFQERQADGKYRTVEKEVEWNPERTAVIVIDMWDDHWCKSAAGRVVELAPAMDEALKIARQKGMFVIHAPSTCTEFYKDTPQRRRAIEAKFSPTPKPLTEKERWGTKWNYPDAAREPELPIDDSDMGCDCREKCEISAPWKRQIDLIEIAPDDAITDNGQETWNLLAERGSDNVIIMGVHLNMCVLGRPFAIRQMVYHGKNVVLVRDMTDTMYDPRMPPKVSHFEGTRLMVGHVERHWCPSILSTDLTGQPAFRFEGDE
jgi:nicotinamidase-related amidase